MNAPCWLQSQPWVPGRKGHNLGPGLGVEPEDGPTAILHRRRAGNAFPPDRHQACHMGGAAGQADACPFAPEPARPKAAWSGRPPCKAARMQSAPSQRGAHAGVFGATLLRSWVRRQVLLILCLRKSPFGTSAPSASAALGTRIATAGAAGRDRLPRSQDDDATAPKPQGVNELAPGPGLRPNPAPATCPAGPATVSRPGPARSARSAPPKSPQSPDPHCRAAPTRSCAAASPP